MYFGKYLPLFLVQQIHGVGIFLDLLLVLVVARITHVALPCELNEKLTGPPCAPSFFKSGLIRILHQYSY